MMEYYVRNMTMRDGQPVVDLEPVEVPEPEPEPPTPEPTPPPTDDGYSDFRQDWDGYTNFTGGEPQPQRPPDSDNEPVTERVVDDPGFPFGAVHIHVPAGTCGDTIQFGRLFRDTPVTGLHLEFSLRSTPKPHRFIKVLRTHSSGYNNLGGLAWNRSNESYGWAFDRETATSGAVIHDMGIVNAFNQTTRLAFEYDRAGSEFPRVRGWQDGEPLVIPTPPAPLFIEPATDGGPDWLNAGIRNHEGLIGMAFFYEQLNPGTPDFDFDVDLSRILMEPLA